MTTCVGITINDDSVVKCEFLDTRRCSSNISNLIWLLIKQEAPFLFIQRFLFNGFYSTVNIWFFHQLSKIIPPTTAVHLQLRVLFTRLHPYHCAMQLGNYGAICLQTIRREWIGFHAQDIHGCRNGPFVVIRPNDDIDEGGRRASNLDFREVHLRAICRV